MATGVLGREQNSPTNCHMPTFLTWNLDPRIRSRIEATCFRYFLSIPKTVHRLNMKLITALVKFYDLKENAFAFGESNKFYVDIGLEDILYSTGFPIDGLQVSGYEDKHPWRTIQEHLKVREEEARSLFCQKSRQSSFTVDLKKLKSKFEKVPDDAIDLMPYQKAYLFFLVGSLLFGKTTESVSPIYLPLLGESVNDYAWGAATLAFIKHGLVSVRKGLEAGKTKKFSGFTYALMIFAVERFPCLREALGIDPPPPGFPLLSGWLNLFPKGHDKNTNVKYFQNKLDNMMENQVTWQPYKLSGRNLELPDEYKDHVPMIYSCTACICFNVVAYNCPHKFFKQLGLAEVCIPNEMPDMKILPNLSLSKNKNKDWRKKKEYEKVNEYWDKRHDYYVVNAGEMDLSLGLSRNRRSRSSEQIHNEENESRPMMNSPSHSPSSSGTDRVEANNNDQVDGENEPAEPLAAEAERLAVEAAEAAEAAEAERLAAETARCEREARVAATRNAEEASNNDQVANTSHYSLRSQRTLRTPGHLKDFTGYKNIRGGLKRGRPVDSEKR